VVGDVSQDEQVVADRDYEQRERHHADQRADTRNTRWLSLGTAIVGVLTFVITFIVTQDQSQQSAEQFRQQFHRSTIEFEVSSRADRYGQIVGGLDSSAAAVQTSSMRQLTDFVRDRRNFSDQTEQGQGVLNAVQTLLAFIEDKSTVEGQTGLTDYQSPIPIILSRAMSRLAVLLEDVSLVSYRSRLLITDTELGGWRGDVSRANLHGISLPGFQPLGRLTATAADFRRADLARLDLSKQVAQLNSAFFTCASLVDARLGPANLAGADLSGADLSGADLSHVTGLDADQLRGATTSSTTLLPGNLPDRVRRGWGVHSPRCFHLVNAMTGMRGGQGYSEVLPCPKNPDVARRTRFDPRFSGDFDDLVRACSLRGGAPL
jgi:uncharacterized protein YjbI with pentapeptide repeats